MYEKLTNARIIYMIFARKIIKIPEFLRYLPEKLTKFPNFYAIFARKMPEFYIIIFSRIWEDVPSPVSIRLCVKVAVTVTKHAW